MKRASKSTSLQQVSSQPSADVEITKEEYKQLPRWERIYYSVMYPRHFQITSADEQYFEMMKLAFSLMMSSETDHRARQLIKLIKPGVTLNAADTLELIHATKEFFGKIDYRNKDFDRMIMRHRIQDNANRARLAGDYKEERLALGQLARLDALEIAEAEAAGPQFPPLPDITFKVFEDAIIESQPYDGSEEE